MNVMFTNLLYRISLLYGTRKGRVLASPAGFCMCRRLSHEGATFRTKTALQKCLGEPFRPWRIARKSRGAPLPSPTLYRPLNRPV
jgi:hypothetical protein